MSEVGVGPILGCKFDETEAKKNESGRPFVESNWFFGLFDDDRN